MVGVTTTITHPLADAALALADQVEAFDVAVQAAKAELSVTDVEHLLGVARTTAHRLLGGQLPTRRVLAAMTDYLEGV